MTRNRSIHLVQAASLLITIAFGCSRANGPSSKATAPPNLKYWSSLVRAQITSIPSGVPLWWKPGFGAATLFLDEVWQRKLDDSQRQQINDIASDVGTRYGNPVPADKCAEALQELLSRVASVPTAPQREITDELFNSTYVPEMHRMANH
jgi:hypothetical protein